jgi:tetratricopeptide (TPR) repeat protein
MKIILKYFLLLFLLTALFSCKSGSSLVKNKEEVNSNKQIRDNSDIFIEATKQRILGNYDKAANLYNQCLDLNPDDAASMFELSKLFLLQNRIDQAIQLAKGASEIDPGNIYYLLLYGNLLESVEDYEKSIEVFEKIAATAPDNIEYQYQLAIAYMYAGKPDKAIDVYNDLEQKTGINEEFSLKKQQIYLEQDRFDAAVNEIEKLSNAFPGEGKYYAILAEMYLNRGMTEKAHDYYKKIAEVDPGNPYIHISLADFYKKQSENDKAFEELKLGFSNPNLDVDTKIQILIAYYTVPEVYIERKSEAFELAEILTRVHGDDPKPFSIYGDFLYQEKRLEEARDAFRNVITLDSSKYIVWEQLLFTESELNDTEALISESKVAIELFPLQPLPYLFSGGAYYQKKEWKKCIKILNQGIKYVVDNPIMRVQFYAYLGDAYNQIGDNINSDNAYDKALKINPDNDYILNNYAYYLSLRKEKLEQAAKMAKRATEVKPNNSTNQDTYAWVLYVMGDYEEARVWMEKALENDNTNSPVLLEHYGDILWQLGDKEQAVSYWIKAKEAGKGSEFLDRKVEEKKLFE